jgi:hypothetical protein
MEKLPPTDNPQSGDKVWISVYKAVYKGFLFSFKQVTHSLVTVFGGGFIGADLGFYFLSTFSLLVTTNHYIKR